MEAKQQALDAAQAAIRELLKHYTRVRVDADQQFPHSAIIAEDIQGVTARPIWPERLAAYHKAKESSNLCPPK